MDRHRHLTAAALAALMLMAAGCSPAVEEPDPPAPVFDFQMNRFSYELRTDVGDPWSLKTGGDGSALIALRYDVTNTGEAPAPATSVPAVVLVSPSGQRLRPDPALTEVFRSEQNAGVTVKSAGDLNPGVRMTDGLVFEVAAADWRKGGWALEMEGQPGTHPVPAEPGAI